MLSLVCFPVIISRVDLQQADRKLITITITLFINEAFTALSLVMYKIQYKQLKSIC